MKYLDYAAFGAASGAYAEASRAQAGVNQLWTEMQRLRRDIDNQKHEREFQKWVEELIYQFSKTVTVISTSPADPLHDYLDIISFLDTIKENNLSTSRISGIENKGSFEKILLEARHLLKELEDTEEVRDYIHQQEQARLEEERVIEQARLEEERQEKEKAARVAIYDQKINKVKWRVGAVAFVVWIICSPYFINSDTPWPFLVSLVFSDNYT